MPVLTTFHLLEKTFLAIIERGQRDIIVAKRADTQVGERVHICNDDLQQAVCATVALVEYSKNPKHDDVMSIVIKDVEEIDYAICD